MAGVAEEWVKMARSGAGLELPEVSVWAEHGHALVSGKVHKLVSGERTASLQAYGAGDKAAVGREAEARGLLVPAGTKALCVAMLKRSDSHTLEEGDRKAGFPTSILAVPEYDLSWEQLQAKAGELSLPTGDWVPKGVNAKRFAALLVHLVGLVAPTTEEGSSERRDAPAPGPGLTREERGGMVLDEADWDELVTEGLALGITGFADQENGPRIAALLHRQVVKKRKKAPAGDDREDAGRLGKTAKESDLAALADAVELQAQTNQSRYDKLLAEVKDQMDGQAKTYRAKDAHHAGQLRMAVATHDWVSPTLRGQYDGLVPLMQVALAEGNETVCEKIQEHMDILVIANRVPNGPELMQRVLEDRKDDRMQVTEKLFDVARARQVKEAKDMRVLGFQPAYGPLSPPLAAPQMSPPALGRGGAATTFGAAAGAQQPNAYQHLLSLQQGPAGPGGQQLPFGPPPYQAPMRQQQLQLGGQQVAGAGAGGQPIWTLEPRTQPLLRGQDVVLNTQTGMKWPLRPLSSQPGLPGYPVRDLNSPITPPASVVRDDCQICGHPGGQAGTSHMKYACPTARAWMQRGWVDNLCKPTPACPPV